MINLLPPAYKQAVHYGQLNVVLARYIFVALVTTLLIGGIMLFGVSATDRNKQSIEQTLATDVARAAQLESINQEAQTLADNIDVIAELLDNELRFSELLREIGSIIPSGVALSDLTITDDQTEPLTLEVDARNEAAIGVFLENLNASDLFAGGEINQIQRLNEPKDGTGYQYTGSIKAFFAPEVTQSSNGGAANE